MKFGLYLHPHLRRSLACSLYGFLNYEWDLPSVLSKMVWSSTDIAKFTFRRYRRKRHPCHYILLAVTDLSNPCRYPRFRPSSVRWHPEACLRYWCSERYQRISLLHRSFQLPLCPSSQIVSMDRSEVELRYFTTDLSGHLSVRFTPNDSG